MKTIIKIVIALAFLTAAAQAGLAAWTNYEFEDAVHESLIFNPSATDKEIIETALSLASNQGIPLEADGIRVRQVGPDLHVEMTYQTEVPLLPGIYSRTFTFNPSTSTRLMPGVRKSPTRR